MKKRRASMKRIVNALGRLNWGKRACAVFVLCVTTAIAPSAQTLTTLHSFDGTYGANPYAGLVQATNGDGYGTTPNGGANGYGTVFKITPSGTLTVLYSFCSQSGCTDGANPQATLAQATNGNFYGTTSATDPTSGKSNGSNGTIFKITPGGTLTTLYSFCSKSGCTDGENPVAGLIQATNGDLYGTTSAGGANCAPDGCGTVFKITPIGTLTTLYSFCSQSGCPDGNFPTAGLVQAANGTFYGTTFAGGAHSQGTVFKIAPDGTLTTLYSFCAQSGCTDGANPNAGLVQATNGHFYGTTVGGGVFGGGTVFEITPSGTLTRLHSFNDVNGPRFPYAGLVQGTDGNFYGTTINGVGNSIGAVFKITPGGALTTLYSFCTQSGCPDGADPYAGLVQATNGDFYGTTTYGGGFGTTYGGYGTVFSLSVGLGPFVKTLPTSGRVGAAVRILGSDLTGTTSVSFDGTEPAFTVVSKFLITTTVPAGASSGEVQVVTPSGTLSSNVPFRVLP
jgi:uncharacterized repeat protein (TIGR03803 family)